MLLVCTVGCGVAGLGQCVLKPLFSAIWASFLLYSKFQLVRCSMVDTTRLPERFGHPVGELQWLAQINLGGLVGAHMVSCFRSARAAAIPAMAGSF